MKKDRIAHLKERYLTAKKEEKDPYFDADEIDALLDSFEESGDLSLYDEVMELGLRLHPLSPELRMRQCRYLILQDEAVKALEMLRFIGKNGSQEMMILEIECYVAKGDYGKVIELTENLIRDNSEHLLFVFEYIAPALNDNEMFAEAIDFVEKGLRLFPDSIILKEELCFALENTEDFEQAVTICNELIDQAPYSFEQWFTLGRLYAYMGNYDKAIEAFDFALTCDDSVMDLKLLLVYCLNRNENYERAIDICKDLLQKEPYSESITTMIAECYMKAGNQQAAYQALKNLIDNPDCQPLSSLYIQLMVYCIEMQRLDEAYDTLMEAKALFPNDQQILFVLSFFPKDTRNISKENFFAYASEMFDMMDKLYQNKGFVAIVDKHSISVQSTGDPEILARSLAKEYITNKSNSN